MYSTLQGPYMFPRRTVLLHEAHSHSLRSWHTATPSLPAGNLTSPQVSYCTRDYTQGFTVPDKHLPPSTVYPSPLFNLIGSH